MGSQQAASAAGGGDATPRRPVPIDQLFRIDRLPPSWPCHVLLALYAPLGIVIFVLRLFVGVHAFAAACILPKTSAIRPIVLRCLCTLLGMVVRQRGTRDGRATVLVCNHVTALDHVAVQIVAPCLVACVWNLPAGLRWALGFYDFGAQSGRRQFIHNLQQHVRTKETSLPVLAFPEGATTSGAVGLLKFQLWPFALDTSTALQPMLIDVAPPPLLRLHISRLGSRWWSELFWLLFLPATLFTITWLPVASRKRSTVAGELDVAAGENGDESMEETPAHFAQSVAERIAAAGRLRVTPHTAQDAVEYAKRTLLDEASNRRYDAAPATNGRSAQSIDAQVQSMCRQVKEMLPQVPLAVITADIQSTRSVEETMANLLEGRVQYAPERSVTPSAPAAKCGVPSSACATSSANVRSVPAPPAADASDPSSWHSVMEHRKRHMVAINRALYLHRKGMDGDS